jgi:uncharacterized repeat protein (TIGR03803 family)
MLRKNPSLFLAASFVVTLGFLAIAPTARGASAEQVLYSFAGGTSGGTPSAGLVFDSSGNLYGTTQLGGAHNRGTVFELSPSENGAWTNTILYSFAGGEDGANPVASLILDGAGSLYGTTQGGGGKQNAGTVFKLSPSESGAWTETVLHRFVGGPLDGAIPKADLIFDANGNLYGTTSAGGGPGCEQSGCGTVFKLTPQADGKWKETLLHSFAGGSRDGASPWAKVTFDAAGNLYGTTVHGTYRNRCNDSRGCGSVFELTPNAHGKWNEKVLYAFEAEPGSYPEAGLILDSAGNLYGTTTGGGEFRAGTVFELIHGSWTHRVLHSFEFNRKHYHKDGSEPSARLVMDQSGNLYGTTVSGGAYGPLGTVFELALMNGKWTETVLHSFDNNRKDGIFPYSNLVFDSAWNLYGTTSEGGTSEQGTVFEITP